MNSVNKISFADKAMDLFLLVKGEVRKAMFPGIFIAVFFAAFALLSLFLNDRGTKDSYQGMLIASLGQSSMYMAIFRIVAVFRSTSNLDRDRISYLRFSKYQVSFAKIFSDVMLFTLTVLMTVLIGVVFLVTVRNVSFDGEYIGLMVLVILGLMFLFLFTIIGIQWIYSVVNGWTKWIWIAAFMLISFIGISVLAILLNINDLLIWFNNNRNIIAWIPVLNFVNTYYILYVYAGFAGTVNPGSAELAYLVIPSIAYSIIFAIVVWRPFSSAFKTRLCV